MLEPSATTLRDACETLAKRDPALAAAFEKVDLPNWRTTEASYASLARIVVYQLISTKAADAIWGRIQERLGEVTAQAVLKDDQERLRACGLSRPKLGHLNAIAEAVLDGTLDFAALGQAPIDEARKTLIGVRGIGLWTADTFLMTALGHLDAFPSGDVGLIEAYRQLSGAERRLSAKAFSQQAEVWRPWRAVAAHLLYDWYNLARN